MCFHILSKSENNALPLHSTLGERGVFPRKSVLSENAAKISNCIYEKATADSFLIFLANRLENHNVRGVK